MTAPLTFFIHHPPRPATSLGPIPNREMVPFQTAINTKAADGKRACVGDREWLMGILLPAMATFAAPALEPRWRKKDDQHAHAHAGRLIVSFSPVHIHVLAQAALACGWAC